MYMNKGWEYQCKTCALEEQKSSEKEVVNDKTSQVQVEATVILDKGLCVWKGRKKLYLNSRLPCP